MDDLSHWLKAITSVLKEVGARYAVVGGLAVGARSEARFTRDIDLAIATTSDAEAERIIQHLLGIGFRPMMELDNTRTKRLATMRLLPPGVKPAEETDESLLIDLIFDTCGIEPEVVAAATTLMIFPGVSLPVAGRPHLIAMKLLSVTRSRARDLADIQALIDSASEPEIDKARELVQLITSRGYHRGRDLTAALKRHLGQRRGGAE